LRLVPGADLGAASTRLKRRPPPGGPSSSSLANRGAPGVEWRRPLQCGSPSCWLAATTSGAQTLAGRKPESSAKSNSNRPIPFLASPLLCAQTSRLNSIKVSRTDDLATGTLGARCVQPPAPFGPPLLGWLASAASAASARRSALSAAADRWRSRSCKHRCFYDLLPPPPLRIVERAPGQGQGAPVCAALRQTRSPNSRKRHARNSKLTTV